jgi:elongation factor 1-gamma
VYGEEPALEIRGVWVWRGTEAPQEIKDLDSYDYHVWRKLDLSKADDKALVSDYWTHLADGEKVEGLKIQTAKYFK